MEEENEVVSLDDLIEGSLDGRKFRSKNLINATLKGERPIIVPFSDLHCGSPHFNEELFLKNLQWVYENKNVYVIGNGDWMEAATKTSVGAGVYEQILSVNEQLDNLNKWFKPLAKQGRILGITNGNHEDRLFKSDGVDITRVLSQMLEVPYFKNGAFFKIRVGKQNYHLYATHGTSAARLPYTKIKNCLDLARFIDSEIYVMGHVHDTQVHTQEYMFVDNKDKMIRKKPKYFILSGHYLNWEDSYAQQASMVPSQQGTPKIKLASSEHRIRISI